jgi:menaquinone-dependent protoporphyrinogen oxidase
MRVLIAYGTSEGQTARIAGYIAGVIRDRGVEAHAVDIKGSDDAPHLDRYDAVIIGASIHMGKHERYVSEFARAHQDVLERVPSAFFSVSLAAYDDREEAQRSIDGFLDQTGWRPEMVAAFAGALLYTQYGFLKRRLLKHIARTKGTLDTDTSHDYVYTDWETVQRFAEGFLSRASKQRPPQPLRPAALR